MDYVLKFNKGIKYYNQISYELADRFIDNFENTINQIEINPFIYQLRYKNIRIANFSKFPYSIHFIVENESIFILNVLHQKSYYKES